jgi:hypothetical protein
MTWRITALALVSLSGCLAHERPDALDAAVLADASSAADGAPDAFVPVDLDAGPAVCAPSELAVAIRVEPVTSEIERCTFAHWERAALTGVDAAPDDDGIRIHFDLCPAADADCRCDVVVTNVGVDVASTLHPDPNVTIDIAEGEGFAPGPFVAITKVPTCECAGCGCGEPLYLYAATGPADFAAHVPAPMTFSRGDAVCPASLCAFGGTWMLHAAGDLGASDVPGGTTRDVGAVRVRSVRDVEVWEPCAACATCGTAVGAWIAWIPT